MENGGNVSNRFFVVRLHTEGWMVGVSHSPEERVLTSIFRLSREQRSRLSALKVKFYRALGKKAVMRVAGWYVVKEKDLPEIEREFRAIEGEFLRLRAEVYSELKAQWDQIEKKLREYAESHGINVNLERLRPEGEEFLGMRYSITPLDMEIASVFSLAEELEKKARESQEWKAVAERVREEGNRMLRELRKEYEAKIRRMMETVEELKGELRESRRKLYRARILGLAEEARDIADMLGEDAMEDLKFRLEALKEALTAPNPLQQMLKG
jgi:predicted DsbA family dithiol-disulfide isomerase